MSDDVRTLAEFNVDISFKLRLVCFSGNKPNLDEAKAAAEAAITAAALGLDSVHVPGTGQWVDLLEAIYISPGWGVSYHEGEPSELVALHLDEGVERCQACSYGPEGEPTERTYGCYACDYTGLSLTEQAKSAAPV